jgi:hypothetical protein
MLTKLAVFGVLAFLLLPVTSFAQSPSQSVNSAENLNIAEIPNDSILLLSKEESDIPGYVHEKYVFVSVQCPGGSWTVDHYGAPIDPRDPALLASERAHCEDFRYRMLEEHGD